MTDARTTTDALATAAPPTEDDLATDRHIAEELQSRLRRDHQTATALRAYLLARRDEDVRRSTGTSGGD